MWTMERSGSQIMRESNLYFLEQEGGVHNGEYAEEYFYNGLCWIWNDQNNQ